MTRPEAATAFLQMCSSGQVREAFSRFVAPSFKSHNPHFKGDADSLMAAMIDAAKVSPKQVLLVKHVLETSDLVAVHSHVRPDPHGPGFMVFHLLRFEGEKVVELWDVAQLIPPGALNVHGAF